MSHRQSPVSVSIFANCNGSSDWTQVYFDGPLFTQRQLKNHAINEYHAEYTKAIEFCRQTNSGRWFKLMNHFWFENPHDAMVFKLRFG
jgi:hypothetical protein